jgi:spore coat polysaccharide biosynthesis predicted glycosyltransferase SpsG
MGLPTIVIILADNQQPVAEKLGLLGVVLNLGWHTTLIPEQISQLISKLLSSPDTRRQMAQRGQVMVDGQGANRVVNLLVDWFE